MATSPIGLQQGYGIGSGVQNLAPFSIIANRAPTTLDRARIGTFWAYTGANSIYCLTSVTNGQSNWLTLSSTGSGIFLDLTVNGPSIFNGTSTFNGNITQIAGVTSLLQTTINGSLTQNGGATLLNTDNIAQTVNIGTGAAAKTVTLGSTNTTSTTTINSGSGNINLNGSTIISKAGLVLQTNCTAGGATTLQSVQLSDDTAGVLFSTLKRRTGGTITGGDRLYLHLINGQQGGADRLAAAIDSFSQTVGAGFVSADIGFTTTNNAGLLARRLAITSEGQINIETAGQTLGIKQGANQMAGELILGDAAFGGVPGTATVNNTQVNANSIILLSRRTINGVAGPALIYSIAAGASFTVIGADPTTGLAVATDQGIIAYTIVQRVP